MFCYICNCYLCHVLGHTRYPGDEKNMWMHIIVFLYNCFSMLHFYYYSINFPQIIESDLSNEMIV